MQQQHRKIRYDVVAKLRYFDINSIEQKNDTMWYRNSDISIYNSIEKKNDTMWYISKLRYFDIQQNSSQCRKKTIRYPTATVIVVVVDQWMHYVLVAFFVHAHLLDGVRDADKATVLARHVAPDEQKISSRIDLRRAKKKKKERKRKKEEEDGI